LSYFDRAAKANPQFRDAAYERARTSILLGDLDTAMAGFERLARDFADPTGMAYLGYCFNLKQENAAAIAWYERALALGFETSGLHNNLGVSYQIARSQHSFSDRLALAERHLRLALELDPRSLVIRRNLVRLDLAKASADRSYVPQTALRHLQPLLDAKPADPTVWMDAARLYSVLAQNESRWLDEGVRAMRNAVRYGGGPTEHELLTDPALAGFQIHPDYSDLHDAVISGRASRKQVATSRFVDPVLLSSQGDTSH
jgi:tetratricopeptide (TPR) repeat protein